MARRRYTFAWANISRSLLLPITSSRPLRKKSWASTFLVPPPRFFRRAQPDLERRNDLLGQFVLHCKDIGKVAIKAVGPNVRAARGIDELAGNPHPVARLANAAFQQVAHAEFAANLLHVDRLALR